MWNLPVASVGIVVLGFGDPAAAIIGRRYGRVKLVNGRTLEGTATFVAVGTLVATSWLAVVWGMDPALALLGFFGALAGGIAELFSRRVDDNLVDSRRRFGGRARPDGLAPVQSCGTTIA